MKMKRKKISRLMFLFFVVGITINTAFGDPNETFTIDFKLNTDLIGKLNQVAAGMTTFGCGPVALVNSMVYLQKKFPSIYGNSLVGEPTETNLKTAAATLASDTYMRTISENLTYPEYFVSGTYDYLEAKKKDKTEYDGDYVLGWDNNKGTNKSEYNLTTWLPDKPNYINWNTLLSSIDKAPSVIYVENLITGSAHYLTLSSIHLTYFVEGGALDNSKPRKIDFIDPYDGKLKEIDFREENQKFQIFYDPLWETDHTPQWWNVQMVYNQKPVPEPATILLLGLGGLILRRKVMRRNVLFSVLIITLFLPVCANAAIVYENTTNPQIRTFANTVGDTVSLAGMERFVTQISVGVITNGKVPVSDDEFKVSLWAADGPDDGAGTLLWQSDFFNIPLSGMAELISFDVPNVQVPDTLIWKITQTDYRGDVGFLWANPPSVGSSPDYGWAGSSKQGPYYGTPCNYMSVIEAVPEPTTLLLLGLGGLWLRKKTPVLSFEPSGKYII